MTNQNYRKIACQIVKDNSEMIFTNCNPCGFSYTIKITMEDVFNERSLNDLNPDLNKSYLDVLRSKPKSQFHYIRFSTKNNTDDGFGAYIAELFLINKKDISVQIGDVGYARKGDEPENMLIKEFLETPADELLGCNKNFHSDL